MAVQTFLHAAQLLGLAIILSIGITLATFVISKTKAFNDCNPKNPTLQMAIERKYTERGFPRTYSSDKHPYCDDLIPTPIVDSGLAHFVEDAVFWLIPSLLIAFFVSRGSANG